MNKRKHLKTLIICVLLLAIISFSLSGCNIFLKDPTDGGSEGENPNANIGTPVTLSNVEKQAIINGTYGSEATVSTNTYYGVGRTLNVITDEYINVASGYKKVFDTDKLMQLNWHRTYAGKMEAETFSGSSMSEFFTNISTSYNRTVGGSVTLEGFTAGAERQFGFSAGVNYKNTANEIYYTSSQNYAANLIEIDEYYDLEQFQTMLSSDIVYDAERVQSGVLSAADFIYKYGTHAVLAGYYGGRIDYYYYLRNTASEWGANASISYMNKVGIALGSLASLNSSSSFSISSEIGLKNSEVEETFKASGTGGANFMAMNLNDFKTHYGEWVSSMNSESVEHSTIVGLPNRSLAAIWDLLPDSYSGAKEILSSYFESAAQYAKNEFLEKYQRHFTAPVAPNAPTKETFISYNILSCALDNGYNYTKPGNLSEAKFRHDHFQLGEFKISDANVSENNIELVTGYNGKLEFRLGYDTTNLPTAGSCTSNSISNDGTKMSNYYNMPYNIGEQKPGYGLLCMTITYNDGTPQERILMQDIFKNKKGGDLISLVNNINKSCTIDIAILYELQQWAPGFLGISDDYWTNWRINKTFNVTVKD